MIFMEQHSSIYVAGHTGMIGKMIVKELQERGFTNIVFRTRKELDLLDQQAVENFFNTEKPEYVFLAAAKVGGFNAITASPADFLFENVQIQNNVIWSAYKHGVKKLLFLSSNCVYPRECIQPMKEEYIMDGKVDPTTESYAIAKITGMELCRNISKQYGKNFISCIATNVYGEGDSFDPVSSRIIASLIRKFYEAKIKGESTVTVWGTGNARRELLYVSDLAKACVFLMEKFDFTLENYCINVGTGEDVSIKELAEMVRDVIGYTGTILWDASKPEGMQQKLLDVRKVEKLGWKYEKKMRTGIQELYKWYLNFRSTEHIS